MVRSSMLRACAPCACARREVAPLCREENRIWHLRAERPAPEVLLDEAAVPIRHDSARDGDSPGLVQPLPRQERVLPHHAAVQLRTRTPRARSRGLCPLRLPCAAAWITMPRGGSWRKQRVGECDHACLRCLCDCSGAGSRPRARSQRDGHPQLLGQSLCFPQRLCRRRTVAWRAAKCSPGMAPRRTPTWPQACPAARTGRDT
mmetsp:Transcript_37/g.92  ORF Transcript_37/g.92 Transcript_37/m.92 type:complete len:203 (-) Transcript_37:664-1272(-)